MRTKSLENITAEANISRSFMHQLVKDNLNALSRAREDRYWITGRINELQHKRGKHLLNSNPHEKEIE